MVTPHHLLPTTYYPIAALASDPTLPTLPRAGSTEHVLPLAAIQLHSGSGSFGPRTGAKAKTATAATTNCCYVLGLEAAHAPFSLALGRVGPGWSQSCEGNVSGSGRVGQLRGQAARQVGGVGGDKCMGEDRCWGSRHCGAGVRGTSQGDQAGGKALGGLGGKGASGGVGAKQVARGRSQAT